MVRRDALVRFLSAGLLALAVAGCACLECTSPGMMDGLIVVGDPAPAAATACVSTSGYGFFYLFTAVCGNVVYSECRHDVKGGPLFFSDKCNCTDCYRAMQEMAKDRGNRLTDVNMYNNSYPRQGVTGFGDIVGWFVESKDVGCSAILRAQ